MDDSLQSPQYTTFKDCLARRVLAEPGIIGQADSSGDQDDTDALDDFTSYLSEEIWPTLPPALRSATYETRDEVPDVDDLPLENTVPLSFVDTLTSCGLASADSDGHEVAVVFLRKVLRDYVGEACAPPPVWSKTRTTECEICEREVPLTYHHLIPREVHDKVKKKKWHPEAMLNSVAWLCRSVACLFEFSTFEVASFTQARLIAWCVSAYLSVADHATPPYITSRATKSSHGSYIL